MNVFFAGTMHLVSYKIDPETPRPSQDFNLYLTFKNDYERPIAHATIELVCPENMICPDPVSATVSSYGVQEFIFPIKSNSIEGLNSIEVKWQDGAYTYKTNESDGNSYGYLDTFTASIPINVKASSFSKISATTSAYYNEETLFYTNLTGSNLHNVQISLYSPCMSFSSPLYYYDYINGDISLETPTYVNCKEGNNEVTVSLISDELAYTIPINVKVDARPHANIKMKLINNEIYSGKDYIYVNVSNNGEKAEKLTLSITHNTMLNSPDVIYLGDFNGTQEVMFKIESDDSGKYPFQIEAKWNEGDESFSSIQGYDLTLKNKDISYLPILVVLCLIGIWFLAKWQRK